MGEVQPIPQNIICILCKGVVPFKDGDKSRFADHMNNDHKANSGINFFLAGCLMSREQIKAVETVIGELYNIEIGDDLNDIEVEESTE